MSRTFWYVRKIYLLFWLEIRDVGFESDWFQMGQIQDPVFFINKPDISTWKLRCKTFQLISLFLLQFTWWTDSSHCSVRETHRPDLCRLHIQCSYFLQRRTVHLGQGQLWPPRSWLQWGSMLPKYRSRTQGSSGHWCSLRKWWCSDPSCYRYWSVDSNLMFYNSRMKVDTFIVIV